jgi:pimeloyl-ACP methyl ester carboxylesterase
MEDRRIHRAVSADGTMIAGRVHGHGPPLVFVHGGLGDGERSWGPLLGLLGERFTCHTMSTRGRGRSAAPVDGDHSLARLVEDVVAYVESIGSRAGLIGYSSGGMLAFGAAARSAAVSAVAVYEPPVFEVPSEDRPRPTPEKAARAVEAVADGRAAEAARIMIRGVATDDELVALEAQGAFEAWAPNVRVGLQEVPGYEGSRDPGPTHPSVLAGLTVPVLYLHGARTPTDWYVAGARHVGANVSDVRVEELTGAGHFAPLLAPEPIADALARFFESAPRPV